MDIGLEFNRIDEIQERSYHFASFEDYFSQRCQSQEIFIVVYRLHRCWFSGLQEFAVFLATPLTVQNADYNYLKVDLQLSKAAINSMNNRGQFVEPSNCRFLLNNHMFQHRRESQLFVRLW